ncbi:hypothetical protein [Bradyrhizobium symbiodeficiens]|uniref:Uncharacterized protein n=1 Tax=Bradyrhizobium symbiodeficiens TaxID=1404367 RepID=A0A6G9A014_9BRAD|nr:hypothetical protein [Bradyrhizobium symbiodeficiens]QIP05553.1 hypothetical protein HAV00_04480 [Bradyrhizobium symbiodeficiens]
MGSEIIRPDDDDAPPAPMPEVEFALVLSRMIDSIQNDPEHLRQTVYQLARHKLEEQLANEGRGDRRKMSRALETAILGVETFAQNNGGLPGSNGPAALPPPRVTTQGVDGEGPSARPVPPVVEVYVDPVTPKRRPIWLTALAVLVLMLPIPWGLSYVVHGGNTPGWLRGVLGTNQQAPKQTAVAVPAAPPKETEKPVREPSPLVPKAYGIYAISADKLYELNMLPGRVPDMRVAISAMIATPSRTVLPDGHIKFIVYRRDSATSAADRAEVRIIAKIENELTFDKAGKPVVSKAADDGWVIRNISLPYRTAPSKDEADMYEVQSEDPDKPLAAGRYALVLKGQGYDFTVAGGITDHRHCLERMSATNGQFYSECQRK